MGVRCAPPHLPQQRDSALFWGPGGGETQHSPAVASLRGECYQTRRPRRSLALETQGASKESAGVPCAGQ